MEQVPPTAKLIESFMNEFVMKKNDIPKIRRKPTFTSVKPLLDAVDKNLINIKDDCNAIYGKLHLFTNTSQLVGGLAQQVVLSTNQGRLTPYVAPITTREQHNYVTRHYKNQQFWLDNQNAE